jgi:RES domain-containing protein
MTIGWRLAHTHLLTLAFQPRGGQARWNSQGTIMAYTSEHPALAAWEVANHWEEYNSLNGYYLYSVEIPDEEIENRDFDPAIFDDVALTRRIGDKWIEARTSVALKVPSVVAPRSWNYLLNVNHPNFLRTVRLNEHGSFLFDNRIERLIEQAKTNP